jgi:hypothetical protein
MDGIHPATLSLIQKTFKALIFFKKNFNPNAMVVNFFQILKKQL